MNFAYPLRIKTETIMRDLDFWGDNMLANLKPFYFSCYLPEIIDSRLIRNMKIRKPHIVKSREKLKKAQIRRGLTRYRFYLEKCTFIFYCHSFHAAFIWKIFCETVYIKFAISRTLSRYFFSDRNDCWPFDWYSCLHVPKTTSPSRCSSNVPSGV